VGFGDFRDIDTVQYQRSIRRFPMLAGGTRNKSCEPRWRPEDLKVDSLAESIPTAARATYDDAPVDLLPGHPIRLRKVTDWTVHLKYLPSSR
jgi:hypothetical protein